MAQLVYLMDEIENQYKMGLTTFDEGINQIHALVRQFYHDGIISREEYIKVASDLGMRW